MSYLFSCQALAKAYGAQTLFSTISLVIHPGDRIGLIGPNGSGKSTLLKIICDLEEPDHGTIRRRKQSTVSYLSQDDRFDEERTLVANLLSALEKHPLEEAEKLSRVQAMLSRAAFKEPHLEAGRLSGGWRKRLSICKALVTEPDLLVMDEPTNHLDIEGIIWLEQLLAGTFKNSPSAFILVSHDRRFLENCVNRVVELSRTYPEGALQVVGSYSSFLQQRQRYVELQNEEEVRLANKVRRETEWLRRGPKARTSKARYRIDEAHRLIEELGEVKGRNRAGSTVSIDFSETGRKTKKLLEARNLSKRYGDNLLFHGLDILLTPGKKIGLLGRNGCGKSTLMKLLESAVDSNTMPDEGTIKTADGISIVSFDQDRSGIDQSQTLRRALAPDGDAISFQGRTIHVVSWAKRFLFRPDQLETPVSQLSGGEQARILIASLMRQPADILLLDEPTNDLDIGSLDVLEDSLLEFNGALVLVTHDRYLLDSVCDHIVGFIGAGTVNHFADYEQWLGVMNQQKPDGSDNQKTPVKKRAGKRKNPPGRLSYMDQREYDMMEEKILAAEEHKEQLEAAIGSPEVTADPARLQETWLELEKVQAQVEHLYARWEELEQKKEQGE